MNIKYDPELGLFLNIPVYEGDFSLRLIQFCIKEWGKYDYDEELVEAIIVAIIQSKGRKQ